MTVKPYNFTICVDGLYEFQILVWTPQPRSHDLYVMICKKLMNLMNIIPCIKDTLLSHAALGLPSASRELMYLAYNIIPQV